MLSIIFHNDEYGMMLVS